MEEFKKLDLYSFIEEKGLDTNKYISEIVINRAEDIYNPWDKMNSMYQIVSGAVKLGSFDKEGNEVIYDVVVEGDFFGNLKYLNGKFSEFARTMVKTKLRLYDLDFFKKLTVHNPTVSEWFNYYIVKRWYGAEIKLFKAHSKMERRVEGLLHDLNINVQDSEGHPHNVINLLTKKDIGDLVGASRQTVSSVLKRFNSDQPYEH